MEKLSLEKFSKFELSEKSAFQVKGGDVATNAGNHYQSVGDISMEISFSSDTIYTEGKFRGAMSCQQTDVTPYEKRPESVIGN